MFCYEWDLFGETAAAWFAGIATFIAALVAVGIYAVGRRHHANDTAKRRKVVMAQLTLRVEAAINHLYPLSEVIVEIHSSAKLPGGPSTELVENMLIPGYERLSALQTELSQFGDPGDVEIASFLEHCHIYNEKCGSIRRRMQSRRFDRDFPWELKMLESRLKDMERTSEAAVQAIERYRRENNFE